MENSDEMVPKDYIEKFNTGYVFSRAYPEISRKVIDQRQSQIENNGISGLLAGMQEQLKELELNRNLDELRKIRNQGMDDKDLEMDDEFSRN